MRILNFGSCNIDYVYSVEHSAMPGETVSSSSLNLFAGGKGLNQSIAAAKAGAAVYHAGNIGADGKMLREILRESGVDDTYLKDTDAKNGHAIIQVSASGENCIVLYPGSNFMLTEEYIDSVLDSFSAGDILLLQNETNLVGYIVDGAFERGMQVVLNPSPFNDALKAIDFSKLSYIILNEVEASAFTGCEKAEDSLSYVKKHYPLLKVMLTLGKNGCIYTDSDSYLTQSVFRVKAVDTTAAGDTFTGYFLAAVADGKPYSDAIRMASAASAIAVSRNGAAPSIPYKNEVEEFLKNYD
ncbi:MAG: ribokinase [Clostridia bacterium]|nr:ribokinase [Clostridia bacterium]